MGSLLKDTAPANRRLTEKTGRRSGCFHPALRRPTLKRASSGLASHTVPVMAVALFLSVALLGCGGGVGGASGYRITSIQTRATLSPNLTSGWFSAADENTADMYLTDLPIETLTSIEALSQATGHIVHVRMLLRPKPGNTPIEPTALSASVVHVVLAGGQIGVYQGGGFFTPSGSTSDRTFGGSLVGGRLQLGAATGGFADRLGASEMSAGIRTEKDPDRVATVRRALAWALSSAPAVERRGVLAEEDGPLDGVISEPVVAPDVEPEVAPIGP